METEATNLLIRSMESLDVLPIAELEQICFSSPWSERALKESLEKPEYIFLVAELEGRIAGYVGMIRALDEGDIMNLAVFPEFRKRGVGRGLLAALFDRAKALCINRVFLEVRESNEAARALYEKAGFHAIGLRKNFYEAPRENGVLMSWDRGLN